MILKNKRGIIRSGITIALTCFFLTACGGDTPEEPSDTPGTATFNPEITKEPRVFGATNRYEDLAKDPCNENFQGWAKETIGFFIQENKGTWPSTEMSFAPTTVTGDIKACEITVTGANITDPDGGDLNNFTVIIATLPDSLNPIDKEISDDIFMEDEDDILAQANSLNDVDVDKLKNISPITASAIDYATENNMVDKVKFWRLGNNRQLSAVFADATSGSCLATVLDGVYFEEDDRANGGGGWVLVKTEDQQKETGLNVGGSAGQLAHLLNMQIDGYYGESEELYYITGK